MALDWPQLLEIWTFFDRQHVPVCTYGVPLLFCMLLSCVYHMKNKVSSIFHGMSPNILNYDHHIMSTILAFVSTWH